MKGTLCLIKVMIYIVLIIMFYYVGKLVGIITKPAYVKTNTCEVAPRNIKNAVYKMGPMHRYRLHPDGKLEVWLRGKWRNLDY